MHFATVLTSVAFAAFVAAAPAPGKGGNTTNVCQGGKTYCCNNFNQPVDKASGNLLSVPINVIANLQCTPISVLSIVLPLGQCASSTVCCQDVGTNGLVNVQCVGLAL
ncbi:hypothetical protein AURDEDRAFT_185169 [Auricularia subglabra TFB-10046 SS5]|nr:hypothetical protein AURDEDRAFT_185169 [Auricularia subglabra TFB-10046 SS5]